MEYDLRAREDGGLRGANVVESEDAAISTARAIALHLDVHNLPTVCGERRLFGDPRERELPTRYGCTIDLCARGGGRRGDTPTRCVAPDDDCRSRESGDPNPDSHSRATLLSRL